VELATKMDGGGDTSVRSVQFGGGTMGLRGHGLGRDIDALSIDLRGVFLSLTVGVVSTLLTEKPRLGRGAGGVSWP
jgi:phage-related protein